MHQLTVSNSATIAVRPEISFRLSSSESSTQSQIKTIIDIKHLHIITLGLKTQAQLQT